MLSLALDGPPVKPQYFDPPPWGSLDIFEKLVVMDFRDAGARLEHSLRSIENKHTLSVLPLLRDITTLTDGKWVFGISPESLLDYMIDELLSAGKAASPEVMSSHIYTHFGFTDEDLADGEAIGITLAGEFLAAALKEWDHIRTQLINFLDANPVLNVLGRDYQWVVIRNLDNFQFFIGLVNKAYMP